MIHQTIVGIDISKARLDVHLHPSGEAFSVANGKAGITTLVRRLITPAPQAVGLEASGGYEQPLARALHAAGITVFILPPARVRSFARAIGIEAKTDALDAGVIARCLAATGDRLRPYAPDPACERLSALAAHRRRLIAERTGLASQLDTIDEPLVRRMIGARLRSIAHAILVLDKEMQALLDAEHRLGRRFQCLTAVKGVGPVLTTGLVADMPELGRITAQPAAALVGVAPHARQSATPPAQDGAAAAASTCATSSTWLPSAPSVSPTAPSPPSTNASAPTANPSSSPSSPPCVSSSPSSTPSLATTQPSLPKTTVACSGVQRASSAIVCGELDAGTSPA
jgi:transposase